MAAKKQHWTAECTDAFLYSIATDFMCQIEKRMEERNISQTQLAKMIGKGKSYVSQIINNPGNMTLDTMIQIATALELKVSVLAYNDDDADKSKGTINSEIFRICWEKCQRPRDMWDMQDSESENAAEPLGSVTRSESTIPFTTPSRNKAVNAAPASPSSQGVSSSG